ncbi:hypothetical protein D8B26_001255 [Coccidioides posadasii str. Silveira]|uniref:uncharacterized protein n=1 Tax=Coccidioides posadasii (strain RMSCC 757 / Silveira) TaxID=443226 RepID=UPI001BEFC9E5|nr:hypothetical protein D8B26_001255 [Coccidioides posadasii str. Silveira]
MVKLLIVLLLFPSRKTLATESVRNGVPIILKILEGSALLQLPGAGALAISVVLSRNQSPRSYVTNSVVILILIHNTVEDVTMHVLRDNPVWVECADQPVLLVRLDAFLAAKISILIHKTVERVAMCALRDNPVWVECAKQPVLLVRLDAFLAAKISILMNKTVERVALCVLRDPVWVECANHPVLLVRVHALLAAKISILIHKTVEYVTMHALRDHPVWVGCANQPVLLVRLDALLAAKISILIHKTVEHVCTHGVCRAGRCSRKHCPGSKLSLLHILRLSDGGECDTSCEGDNCI